LKHQLKTDRLGVNVWFYASAMLDESSQVKCRVIVGYIVGWVTEGHLAYKKVMIRQLSEVDFWESALT